MISNKALKRSSNVSRGRVSVPYKTTLMDRLLLVAFIVFLPLQADIPTLGGASITFIIIGLSGAYLAILKSNTLMKVFKHPVFLAGFAFAAAGLCMEFVHDSGEYSIGIRIGLMVLGGIIVASLCRDRKALRFAAYGYCMAGVIVSIILILSVYGSLTLASTSATGEDFKEAQQARSEAFTESASDADINLLGFHCAQGVVAALALGLTAGSALRRNLFLALGTLMLLATFLPMSRGAVTILVVSCGAVAYSFGIFRPKLIIAGGILLLGVFMLVPDIVFDRFKFSLEGDEVTGKTESRARLYNAAFEELPDYIIAGVGKTDFYGEWGYSTEFWDSRNKVVVGPHNCFVITLVFWGLPGILTLLTMVLNAYRAFPKFAKGDPLGMFLLGISISTLLEACVVHTLSGKQYSLTLGLIVGSSLWIWKRKSKGIKLGVKAPLINKTLSARGV